LAKSAQKAQIRKSNQKYQEERKKFRQAVSSEQSELIKILNKTIIRDKYWLSGTLKIIRKIVRDQDKGIFGDDIAEADSKEKAVVEEGVKLKEKDDDIEKSKPPICKKEEEKNDGIIVDTSSSSSSSSSIDLVV
jgi:hypothetical protein